MCGTHSSLCTPVHSRIAWDVDTQAWDNNNYPLTQPRERAVWSDDENRPTRKLRGKKHTVPATPPRMVISEESGIIATPPRATKKQLFLCGPRRALGCSYL